MGFATGQGVGGLAQREVAQPKLLEDPQATRPLRGEAWGAAFALRRALRRVATNLAQIEAARTNRQVPAPVGVGEARDQIDAAIRACLDAQATIIGQPGTGGTS